VLATAVRHHGEQLGVKRAIELITWQSAPGIELHHLLGIRLLDIRLLDIRYGASVAHERPSMRHTRV